MPISTPAPKLAVPAPKPRPAAGKRLVPTSALVGLAVGLLAGYGLGRFSIPLGPTYQDGYEAARKKIADIQVFPPTPAQSSVLLGKVTAVGTASLTLEASPITRNPLETPPGPLRRTVNIGSGTKLYRITPKPIEDLRKEYEEALKATDGNPMNLEPIEPFIKAPIRLSEIAVGDSLQVTADHDILKEGTFEAEEIQLLMAQTPPTS